MNLGIFINDIVLVKQTVIIGKVIGKEDFILYPDNLQIVYEKHGELIQMKVRADEVLKLSPDCEELVGLDKVGLPF